MLTLSLLQSKHREDVSAAHPILLDEPEPVVLYKYILSPLSFFFLCVLNHALSFFLQLSHSPSLCLLYFFVAGAA